MNRITLADEPCAELQQPRIEKLAPSMYRQVYKQGEVMLGRLWVIVNGGDGTGGKQ